MVASLLVLLIGYNRNIARHLFLRVQLGWCAGSSVLLRGPQGSAQGLLCEADHITNEPNMRQTVIGSTLSAKPQIIRKYNEMKHKMTIVLKF